MTPSVLDVAAMPLTDEFALLLWIATLGAMLAFLRRPGWSRLAIVVVAALLLTFTRPATYLPIGAALGAFLVVPRKSMNGSWALRLVLAMVAVALVFELYTVTIHGAGLRDQLRWEYDWQRATHGRYTDHGIATWWALSLATAAGSALVVMMYKHNMLALAALAVFGAALVRRSALVGVTFGGAAATTAAILANPLEVERTVLLPLTPLIVLLAVPALQTLSLYRTRGATLPITVTGGERPDVLHEKATRQ